jgi:hypothetical protein
MATVDCIINSIPVKKEEYIQEYLYVYEDVYIEEKPEEIKEEASYKRGSIIIDIL